MVDVFGSLTSFFDNSKTVNREPIINDPFVASSAIISTVSSDRKKFWKYWKRTPELVAQTNAITTDILSDGYRFIGAQINVDKAQRFAEDVLFDLLLEEFVSDSLVTGDSYLWKGAITQSDAFIAAKEFYAEKDRRLGQKTIEYKAADFLSNLDEDTFGTKSLRFIPSTTMSINYQDKFGKSLVFTQDVNGQKAVFAPSEIVHMPFQKVNGETYGFSPVESIFSEMTLLATLKDYLGNFFANNGTPNFMFVLPKEITGSPNYVNLVSKLKEFKKIENKHGNLVFTGEINIQELNKFNKDMEFKNLAEYLTKVIAMVWQVPPSRYGGKDSQGDTSLTNQAYYRNIAHFQSKLEFILNTQLFNEFKVKIRFNRSYKEDEIRESTIQKQKTDITEQRLKLGIWNAAAAFDYLNVPNEHRGDLEAKIAADAKLQSGQLNQNSLPINKVMVDENQAVNNAKRTPNKMK